MTLIDQISDLGRLADQMAREKRSGDMIVSPAGAQKTAHIVAEALKEIETRLAAIEGASKG